MSKNNLILIELFNQRNKKEFQNNDILWFISLTNLIIKEQEKFQSNYKESKNIIIKEKKPKKKKKRKFIFFTKKSTKKLEFMDSFILASFQMLNYLENFLKNSLFSEIISKQIELISTKKEKRKQEFIITNENKISEFQLIILLDLFENLSRHVEYQSILISNNLVNHINNFIILSKYLLEKEIEENDLTNCFSEKLFFLQIFLSWITKVISNIFTKNTIIQENSFIAKPILISFIQQITNLNIFEKLIDLLILTQQLRKRFVFTSRQYDIKLSLMITLGSFISFLKIDRKEAEMVIDILLKNFEDPLLNVSNYMGITSKKIEEKGKIIINNLEYKQISKCVCEENQEIMKKLINENIPISKKEMNIFEIQVSLFALQLFQNLIKNHPHVEVMILNKLTNQLHLKELIFWIISTFIEEKPITNKPKLIKNLNPEKLPKNTKLHPRAYINFLFVIPNSIEKKSPLISVSIEISKIEHSFGQITECIGNPRKDLGLTEKIEPSFIKENEEKDSILQIPQIKIPQTNPHLDQLFFTIEQICTQSCQNSKIITKENQEEKSKQKTKINKEIEYNENILSKLSLNQEESQNKLPEIIIQHLINFFLRLKNAENQDVYYYCLNNPELQTLFLRMIDNYLLNNGSVKIFRNQSFWNVMFSELFNISLHKKMFEDFVPNSKRIYQGMKNFINSLFEYTIIKYQAPEILEFMLKMIANLSSDYHDHFEYIRILKRILSPSIITNTELSRYCFSIVVQLGNIILQPTKEIQNINEDEQLKMKAKLVKKILELLDQLLISSKTIIIVFERISFIRFLMRLLDNPLLKDFVFYHFKRIMDETLSKTKLYHVFYVMILEKIRELGGTLHKFQEKSSQHEYVISLLCEILELCVRAIMENESVMRHQFIDAGAFSALENLLQQRINSDELLTDILHMVIVLTRGKRKFMLKFNTEIGYDKLGVLLSNTQAAPRLLYDFLFRLLVNNDSSKSLSVNFIIDNPDIIMLMFNMFCSFGKDTQNIPANSRLSMAVELLQTFDMICRRSVHNISCCCNVGLVNFLLLQVPNAIDMEIREHLLRLVVVLGSHRMTVPELKNFFFIVNEFSKQKEYFWILRLLQILSEMLGKTHQGPGSFFDFDGRYSSLELPVVDDWPSPKGYSFCSWIRVESIDSPLDQHDYEPRIFSFLNEQEQGIELYLYPQNNAINGAIGIEFRIHNNTPNAKDDGFLNCEPKINEVSVGRWFFIAVTHNFSKKSRYNTFIYINGDPFAFASLKYPVFSSPLTYNRIGGAKLYYPKPNSHQREKSKNIEDPKNIQSNSLDTSEKNTSFDNSERHDSFDKHELRHSFDQSLSDSFDQRILDEKQNVENKNHKRKKKKNSQNDFESQNLFYGQIGTLNFFNEALTADQIKGIYEIGSDYQSFFYSNDLPHEKAERDTFIEAALDGSLSSKIYLNLTSKASEETLCHNQSPVSTWKNPAKIRGMVKCFSIRIQEIFYCLGGVKILFPLLAQLDQEDQNPLNLLNSNISREQYDSVQDFEIRICRQIFVILTDILVLNSFNQKDMIQSFGFSIISHILKSKDSRFISQEMLESIQKLVLETNDFKFTKSLVTDFLMDFDIWIYCPSQIQHQLLQILGLFLRSQQQKISQNQGDVYLFFRVSNLVDILKIYYWIEPNAHSRGVSSRIDSETGKVLGTRPSRSEILELREVFFHLIELLLNVESNGEIRNQNFDFLIVQCFIVEKDFAYKILLIIHHLLVKMVDKFIDALIAVGFMDPFIALIQKYPQNYEIRDLCFQIIKILSFFQDKISTSSNSPSKGTIKTLKKINVDSRLLVENGYSLIHHLISNSKMTQIVLDTMLSLIIKQVVSKNSKKFLIIRPYIIKTITSAVNVNRNPIGLKTILKVERLIDISVENQMELISQFGWQKWFLDLIDLDNVSEYRFGDFEEILKEVLSKNYGEDLGNFEENANQDLQIIQENFQEELKNLNENININENENININQVPFINSQEKVISNPTQKDSKEKEIIAFLKLIHHTKFSQYQTLIYTLIFEVLGQISAKKLSQGETPPKIFISNLINLLIFLENFANVVDEEEKKSTDLMNKLLTPIQNKNQQQIIPDEKEQSQIEDQGYEEEAKQAKANMIFLIQNKSIILRKLIWKILNILEMVGFFNKKSIKTKDRNKSQSAHISVIVFILTMLSETKEEEEFEKLIRWMNLFNKNSLISKHRKQKHREATHILISTLYMLVVSESKGGTVESRRAKTLMENLYKIEVQKKFSLVQKLKQKHGESVFPEKDPQEDTEMKMNEEKFAKILADPNFRAAARWEIKELNDSAQKNIAEIREKYSQEMEEKMMNLRDSILSEYEYERKTAKAFENILEEKTKAQVTKENQRVQFLEKSRTKRMRFVSKKCRIIIRELGCCGGILDQERPKLYYKLDPKEDNQRMRKKLKINFHFDTHYDASVRRDERTQQSTEKLLDEMKKKLVQQAKQSLTALEKTIQNSDGNEMSDVDEESNDTDIEESEMDMDDSHDDAGRFPPARTLMRTPCEMISPLRKIDGMFEITSRTLEFISVPRKQEDMENGTVPETKARTWIVDGITAIHNRSRLYRPSAIEIFFENSKSVFINFPDISIRNKVFHRIAHHKRLRSLNRRIETHSGTPRSVLKKMQLTRMWQSGEICNFDYLMKLNTISGRTYNDLSQYPVFPWIISDYESSELDLRDAKTYRDLSKPIGALNPQRLRDLTDRYRSFPPDEIPFYYGTHYSSAAIALWYLIRIEPFTTLAIDLQGGKFDHPDRLFYSIPDTWKGIFNNPADVKELIPEFFYFPEFLENSNGFNLGSLARNHADISDIVLPPWAKSPEMFVRINREALESDFVSFHLNQWIDLIFGYKQCGEEAAKAYNVFYYLTYPNLVNFSGLNSHEIKAVDTQIEYYGQTPIQLFHKPHPQRFPRIPTPRSDTLLSSRNKSSESFGAFTLSLSDSPIIFLGISEPPQDLSFIGATNTLITLDAQRTLAIHKWVPVRTKSTAPFTFEADPLSGQKSRIGVSFTSGIRSLSPCLAIAQNARFLLACGFWDDSFKIIHTESCKMIQSVLHHKNTVSCLAVENDRLITGSRDTTVLVWSFNTKEGTVSDQPIHILHAHNDTVLCVDLDFSLDVVVSGSRDGSWSLHVLSDGKFVRSVLSPKKQVFSMIKILPDSSVATFSETDRSLCLYTINGKLFAQSVVADQVLSWAFTPDSHFVVLGGKKGVLQIRSLKNLKVIRTFDLHVPVLSLSLSSNHKFLFASLSSGQVFVTILDF
ncbi:beach domain-containing protein lvsc [Anaeramoeba ignava]|uniref:Beach domain-containing protein lvsc n=1 Tax=Anaeramoeba ignava TaxID=1746090 RepID=A0A9Q0LSR7_ANAIG|nr:beach domain-containing protein lvsc [Anaeramoeba ignava]